MAEGPVFFFHFHQINENVLQTHRELCMKALGNGFVEEFFLLDGPAFAHGDLDHHQLVRAVDAQVTGIKDEMLLIVFGEDLEIIVLRHADGAVNGGIDQLPDEFGVGGVPVFLDVDANQWHGQTPEGIQVYLKYMMEDLYQARFVAGR